MAEASGKDSSGPPVLGLRVSSRERVRQKGERMGRGDPSTRALRDARQVRRGQP
jgi:hypothetical protein